MTLELVLLVWIAQKLEAQKSIVDENRRLLQAKLNEQVAKAESIQAMLNGNEAHAKLEELKQKLSNLQQSGIKLQEGKILNYFGVIHSTLNNNLE